MAEVGMANQVIQPFTALSARGGGMTLVLLGLTAAVGSSRVPLPDFSASQNATAGVCR